MYENEKEKDNRGIFARAFDWCCENPALVIIGGIAITALLKVNKLQKSAMVEGKPYTIDVALIDSKTGSMVVTPSK